MAGQRGGRDLPAVQQQAFPRLLEQSYSITDLASLGEALCIAPRNTDAIKSLIRRALADRPEFIAQVWQFENQAPPTTSLDEFFDIMTVKDQEIQHQLSADDVRPHPLPINNLLLWSRLGMRLHQLLDTNRGVRRLLNSRTVFDKLPSRPTVSKNYDGHQDHITILSGRYLRVIYSIITYICMETRSGWLDRQHRLEGNNWDISDAVAAAATVRAAPEVIDLTMDEN